MMLSQPLAELIGETVVSFSAIQSLVQTYVLTIRSQLSRPKIVKLLWARIRENNLQNPADKREILLDEHMQMVFRTKKFTAFSMNKYISEHVSKLEDEAMIQAYLARQGISDMKVKAEDDDEDGDGDGDRGGDGTVNGNVNGTVNGTVTVSGRLPDLKPEDHDDEDDTGDSSEEPVEADVEVEESAAEESEEESVEE